MKTRLLSVLMCAWAAGCVSRPAAPDAEALASDAVGFGGAIVFRAEGAPVDEPGESAALLTQAEAIRMSLASDPRIQQALARVRVALADAKQARLLPNPVVTLILRFPEGGGQPFIEAGLAAELLSLLQRPGRISAADHRLRASAMGAVTVVLDVVAEAQGVYAAAQSLDARAAVEDERRGLLEKLTELADARLSAGEGTKLDLTALRTLQVELEVEALQTQLERRETRLSLARLVGRPSDEAGWALEPWKPVEPLALSESAWVAAAMEHRPEIAADVAALAALGVEVNLARLAILDGSEAGVDAERDGEWSVGPSLTVPLPLMDWGQAKRAKVRAQRIGAMHALTRTRRQVVEEVRRAHAAYTAGAETENKARGTLLPLLEERLELARAAYESGQSDTLPVLLAEQELRAGRGRLIELQRRNAEALIRLHRAVGGAGVAENRSTTSPSQPEGTNSK